MESDTLFQLLFGGGLLTAVVIGLIDALSPQDKPDTSEPPVVVEEPQHRDAA